MRYKRGGYVIKAEFTDGVHQGNTSIIDDLKYLGFTCNAKHSSYFIPAIQPLALLIGPARPDGGGGCGSTPSTVSRLWSFSVSLLI